MNYISSKKKKSLPNIISYSDDTTKTFLNGSSFYHHQGFIEMIVNTILHAELLS